MVKQQTSFDGRDIKVYVSINSKFISYW